jgi:hypothetical protein
MDLDDRQVIDIAVWRERDRNGRVVEVHAPETDDPVESVLAALLGIFTLVLFL